MWWYEYYPPPYLTLLHYLVKVKTPKILYYGGILTKKIACIIASLKWITVIRVIRVIRVIICLKFTYLGCHTATLA